ncbi:MAG: hypothetical protein MJE12_08035, partial [Alphaproteobacteria bacterium]|nr:hypothetical protein [Alphaproteobacteria bacterium]
MPTPSLDPLSDAGFSVEKQRPTLRRGAIVAVVAATFLATVLFFLARPHLPPAWATPGSPELYLIGVLGATLTLTPFAFSLAKRGGRSESPPAWFIAHVIAGCVGIALLIVHSGGYIRRPPALLLAGGVFLVLQGAWARLALPHRIAATFGSKHRPFIVPNTADKEKLAAVIEAKRTLLSVLAPSQSEATFSPLLVHWLRHPILTFRYARLARHEMRIIGQRRAVPAAQAYWRAVHMTVAFL